MIFLMLTNYLQTTFKHNEKKKIKIFRKQKFHYSKEINIIRDMFNAHIYILFMCTAAKTGKHFKTKLQYCSNEESGFFNFIEK